MGANLPSNRSITSVTQMIQRSHRLPTVTSIQSLSRFKGTFAIVRTMCSHVSIIQRETPIANQKIDFKSTDASFSAKTTPQLFRALLVYQLCAFPILVENAEKLLRMARFIFGDTITDNALQATLFGQFCAGNDEQSLQPVMLHLRDHGIGGILDFAAESDVCRAITTGPVHDDELEAAYDRHVNAFRSCIQTVAKVAPDGFVALKVTALGNANVLMRMSLILKEVEQLFSKVDMDGDGILSREEFERVYRTNFTNADEKLADLVEMLDPDCSEKVNFMTWTKLMRPQDIASLTQNRRTIGTEPQIIPTEKELELMDAVFHRAFSLAEEAIQCRVKVLVDAEQTRLQPAINNLVFHLQRQFNSSKSSKSPVIFNTYQCYLKKTFLNLRMDVERSERFSYHFGAKLVRGAYMDSERALADKLGYPIPIHETIEETHACYNESVEFLLHRSVETQQNIEVMCATHNQDSIVRAIQVMRTLSLANDTSKVHFAQLFGMSDDLTFNLGKSGYRVFKYLPYGDVKEVMPYLMRRAQENGSVLGNASRELVLLRKEIWRRLTHCFR